MVANHAAVGAVRLPPDLRVPEIHRAAALGQVVGGQDWVAGILLIIHAVPHGDTLGLPVVPRRPGAGHLPDKDGCFSGSAVELADGRQLLMYTGVSAGPRHS